MRPPKAHKVNKMVPNVVSKKQPRNGTPLGRQKVSFRTIYYTLDMSKLSEKTQLWDHLRLLFGPQVALGRVFRGTLKRSRKIDSFWLPFCTWDSQNETLGLFGLLLGPPWTAS